MAALFLFSRAHSRSQAIAWAAGEPQATTIPPLNTQLLFSTAPGLQCRNASDVSTLSDAAITTGSPWPTGCDVAGLSAAPRGPWAAVTLACYETVLTGLIQVHTGESKLIATDVGPDSIFLGWSPNGNEVLVRADVVGNPQVYHIRAANGQATLLPVPSDTYHVDIAHNGQRMVYALTRGLGYGSELWSADLDGQNAQRLISDPTHIIAYARYSPNGQQLVYIRMIDSNIPFTVGELWVMDADGSNAALLGEADAGHGYEAAWSPDGSAIAYVRRENGHDARADQRPEHLMSNIVVADVNTHVLTAITTLTDGFAESPAWSPDGNTLAFAVFRNGAADIWAYAPQTHALNQITTNANARYPTWLFGR